MISKRGTCGEQKESIADKCGSKRKLVLLLQEVYVYSIAVWFCMDAYISVVCRGRTLRELNPAYVSERNASLLL